MPQTNKPRLTGLVAAAMETASTTAVTKQINPPETAKRKQSDMVIDLTEDEDTTTLQCTVQTNKRARTSPETPAVRTPATTPPNKRVSGSVNGAKVLPPRSPHEPTTSPPDLVTSPLGQAGPNVRQRTTTQNSINLTQTSADEPSNIKVQQQTTAQEGTGLPTPNSTRKRVKELKDMRDISDRYVWKTSLTEGVEYSNPRKFCVSPAFWKKWTPRQYVLLADHMRLQFDPVPFAKETGLPVEEVKHVFSGLICNPLYDAEEAMRRGEEGMFEIMRFYTEDGTQHRQWGKNEDGAKKVVGELRGVTPGSVEVILAEDGTKDQLKLSDLSKDDIEYLKKTLTVEDRRILWRATDA